MMAIDLIHSSIFLWVGLVFIYIGASIRVKRHIFWLDGYDFKPEKREVIAGLAFLIIGIALVLFQWIAPFFWP
jgi:NhaP-type Na+/H+ or K+/H+ antiporter